MSLCGALVWFFRRSPCLKMANPVQVALVKRGDLSPGFRVSQGCQRQKNTVLLRRTGTRSWRAGIRGHSLPFLSLCLCTFHSSSSDQPAQGPTWLPPSSPVQVTRGTHSQPPPTVLPLHLEFLTTERKEDWPSLGQGSCHKGRDAQRKHFWVPWPRRLERSL